jgi:AraC family transcriptional regulator
MLIAPESVFVARDTHGRIFRAGNRRIADSEEMGWRSVHAAIFEEAPFHATEESVGNPHLIYLLNRPTEVSRKIEGGPCNKQLINPRLLCLTPAEVTAHWQHSGNPEVLQVYLHHSLYQSAVSELFGCDGSKAEIAPGFGILDPLLEQLVTALGMALRNRAYNDNLYIDSIAQMMAVHLARCHSSRGHPGTDGLIPTLSGWRMRRVLEYIEERLGGDLSIKTMASEVDISPVYFARAFKAAIGQSPHQYVLVRRIERAKALLRNTEIPVVDIAFSVGFSSQSHLSHWFTRQVGVPPAAYRRPA